MMIVHLFGDAREFAPLLVFYAINASSIVQLGTNISAACCRKNKIYERVCVCGFSGLMNTIFGVLMVHRNMATWLLILVFFQ